jgi:hypothetical protein
MDEIWMKPVAGSTGSTFGTRVAYTTCAESLTPSARDLEDGIEPGLGARGQGLVEALATQARVPRDLRHSASAGDVAGRKQHQFGYSGLQGYLWYPTARTWSPTLVPNVGMRATRRRSIGPARI